MQFRKMKGKVGFKAEELFSDKLSDEQSAFHHEIVDVNQVHEYVVTVVTYERIAVYQYGVNDGDGEKIIGDVLYYSGLGISPEYDGYPADKQFRQQSCVILIFRKSPAF